VAEKNTTVNRAFGTVAIVEECTFWVYRSVLETYAPNFASLFKDHGVTTIKLHNVAADTIEVFVKWLRKQDEAAHPTSGVQEWDRITDSCDWHMHSFLSTDMNGCVLDRDIVELCIDMFIFAEAYGIPILRIGSINWLVLCFDEERTGYSAWTTQPMSTEAIH
jgi:hypothetical protein